MNNNFILPKLPPKANLETVKILKQLSKSNRALAELKGVSKTIPNSDILINTLVLQEAKDSSEIENIITTHDDLYKSDIDIDVANAAAKEVKFYTAALKRGFELIKNQNILTTNHIIEIQKILEQNDAGIRTQSGTVLKNDSTGEIIYTPPQNYNEILQLLKNLENYINANYDIDPLIKMAVIHYQFESIHPFYDGNGRTGRIINILYPILNKLLDIPILYLSKYIIRTKTDYYRLLQEIRTKNSWEEWTLYMLKGVEQTSLHTIELINEISNLMTETKTKLQTNLPKIYSRDLLDILFLHPYTKIEFLVRSLNIHRETSSIYLKNLENIGILKSTKLGRQKYYINTKLYELLKNS
ncbi:MAG: Fic family protein [Candidatus Cloacimonetes bacterium]|nr:Fic family protein [Candidatus Cloacimonadota bacterium]